VPLPAKTLSTLLVLVRKNGHLVEKDVLMKEVWPDEYVEEGNLAQQIFLLRRALGETLESPKYIETVPRRGYRFVAKVTGPEEEGPMSIWVRSTTHWGATPTQSGLHRMD
jgi:DNA-binding winged helix-turn-helix (wHTH) protein